VREFKIPGKVQAKQRPRFSKSGIVYTPKETRVYEDFVRVCYSDYANQYQWEPYDGQLRAEIEVFIQVPKSDSKLNKQAKIIGEKRPTIKPDCDNLAKSLLDSLNGWAYQDDKQIVELEVKKFYSEESGVKVKLMEV
jgi:Holliday junction resolvase RusA-like endonuclease